MAQVQTASEVEISTPFYDGPDVKIIETVSGPAVLGICLASSLFLVTIGLTYLCYRRREAAATKLIGGGGVPETRLSGGGGAPVVFYHSRKPTAVRSPAGSGGYYLKKSPSPSATPLGGSGANSPTDSTAAGKNTKSATNSPSTEET
ncbi:hypothetical protein LSTR_LSTR005351, partial [Laodelphax striatellus]